MGYLSFQIIFFLLLAAALGFIIGWLLRGNRFQSELQDLDNRWRTKLGEVEGERDRFVGELTQSNEAKAKLEAEIKRLSETHNTQLQQLKRDYETKTAASGDADKLTASLKADLASRDSELGKLRADLGKLQEAGGDAGRLGRELTAANERTAALEVSLKDAKSANANCKNEVDRLNATIADLRRSGGTAGGSPSSSSAMGIMGGAGSSVSRPSGTAGSSSGGSGAGTGGASGSSGLRSIEGGGQSGGSDQRYTQRAAAPSQLAESGGQGFSSGSAGNRSEAEENEGVQPAKLAEARGGKADDLKRISGVGPKLEKTLNGLGIFHFSQIAEFNRDNVAWVDRHLRFKGRIDRENWIDQAKILAAGGETEFSKRT
ncbi:MAG: hypothetical protein ACRBM6_04015 [Geminicoccales bacterium]